MKTQPETYIKRAIKDYLRYCNWFVFHNLNYGIGVYKGISDITAMKNGNTLWIEVKSETGRQSEHQIQFESDVKNHGCHYLVARSVDDVNDYIKNKFGENNLLL